ncbi:ABC transporter substrate-binding protein [Chelativorans sp.]|uniref:ABC transporter substrate-binding protein n=1 Tax=Chelativorans sp. TaxID=2203393 RepID=UPI0028117851|nr:ABC transporter substrate-binding protein [Chelativorans sp.]
MHLTRRNLLQLGAASIAFPTFSHASAVGQERRLRGAWWGSNDRTERTLAVGELYRKKTGVVFEGEGAGWADYWPRLATQVSGGNAPDIVQQNHSTISEYARRDILLPLDEYVGNGLDISDFDKSQIDAGTVDGKFYGVSLGYAAFGMIVNAKSWEDAGVELPNLDTTWDEFERMAAEVTRAAGRPNHYGIQDGSGVVGALQNWVRQRGKDLYTAEGKLGYSEEDAADWFALWARLRESGACPPADLQALDQLNIETAMLTLGHAAMSYGYANQLVGYQAVNKDPLALVPPPMENGDRSHGIYLQPAQFFSIARTTADPDLAVDFVNFFVRDPEAALVLGVERGMPASAKIRELLIPKLDEDSRKMAEYLELVGPVGGPMPPAPPEGATEMNATLKRISEEVGFGQSSPQEGARALFAEADRVLSAG